jgi:drug/metabolite transporter (DMT)-like permease
MPRETERPLRGIALLVSATVLFSMSDTTAKYLTGSLPPIEIGWVRYLVFTALATGVAVRSGRHGMRTRRPVWQILRGLGVVGSAVLFIASLASMPIAQATTVNFVSPLLITILSVPVLGERIRFGGWCAVLAGFVGVLIVARPGTERFHPAVLLVLGSSLCWSVSMLITRSMARTERASATLLWTAGTGLIVLTALLPFVFVVPSLPEIGLALLIGLISSGGQWLTLLAYRRAPASVLAPLSYGQLIWSSALGYLVFGSVPSRWTLLGGAIIACSGFYTVREARLQQQRREAAG